MLREIDCNMELQVKRSDFMTALRPLARSVPRHQLGSTAALWVEDGVAVIRFADMEARIPAAGSWPTVVQFGAGFLVALVEHPPTIDSLEIIYQEGRIEIDRLSIDCDVVHPGRNWPDFVELDANYTMKDVIEAWLTHSDEELESSGLAHIVERALSDLGEIVEAGVAERSYSEFRDRYPGDLSLGEESFIALLSLVREARNLASR